MSFGRSNDRTKFSVVVYNCNDNGTTMTILVVHNDNSCNVDHETP